METRFEESSDAAARAAGESVDEQAADVEREVAMEGAEGGDAAEGALRGDEEADAADSLQRERDELHGRYLRLAADYQNFQRRAQLNVTTAEEQQAMSLARALVPVLDHFDRAMEIDADKAKAADVLQGVQMVRDELLRALGRFGVQRMNPEAGEAFDPERHEALMRRPSDEVESGHVIQQLEPGYTLNDKTVRPAKVALAE